MIYLGVIGYPIKHSISPAMHNAALRHLGMDGVYLAFEVRPDELKHAIFGARSLGFKGLNVTIPFKEAVLSFVEPSGIAAKIGAVNTLDLENMVGYNTDAYGAVKALEECDVEVDGKIALVVGAGGAGKAVAFGLIERNATVVITNRTALKGIELAERLRKYGDCIFHPFDRVEELKGKVDLIVNATPLGMMGFDAKLPVPRALLSNVIVFDTVYNPPETPLIREAKRRGCKVVYGLDMLVYQGAKAFEIWTGYEAPVSIMKVAAMRSLEL
jgi:shikimate dehydrogenase